MGKTYTRRDGNPYKKRVRKNKIVDNDYDFFENPRRRRKTSRIDKIVYDNIFI